MKDSRPTSKSTSKKKTETDNQQKQTYKSLFLKYKTTSHNKIPKQIQEAISYYYVVTKLKSICLKKH